jgi:hypothetical protein
MRLDGSNVRLLGVIGVVGVVTGDGRRLLDGEVFTVSRLLEGRMVGGVRQDALQLCDRGEVSKKSKQ